MKTNRELNYRMHKVYVQLLPTLIRNSLTSFSGCFHYHLIWFDMCTWASIASYVTYLSAKQTVLIRKFVDVMPVVAFKNTLQSFRKILSQLCYMKKPVGQPNGNNTFSRVWAAIKVQHFLLSTYTSCCEVQRFQASWCAQMQGIPMWYPEDIMCI